MLRVMSLLATLVLVAAALTLFFGRALVATHPIGLSIQVLAVMLMIWARVTLGMRSFHAAANPTEGGIVTHGPYRFWRHPIYASASGPEEMEFAARLWRMSQVWSAAADGQRQRRPIATMPSDQLTLCLLAQLSFVYQCTETHACCDQRRATR